MNDQTFHTPSFGDEEFDISSLHSQHAANNMQGTHHAYGQIHHQAPQVGMINPAQDGLAPPGGAPSYQQPLYLQEPHTPVTSVSAGAPAGNYMIQQQPGGQQRLLMMQPSQTMSGPHPPSSPTQTTAPQVFARSPQQASPPGTTSDDSDDSVPSQHSQLPGDAESLLPIHYCSASRQQQASLHQIGIANSGVKRSSPEPMDSGINRGQVQKKPKVQKKKKKRDPNEPQKPVSAYALFFRDTQAAIKGQNPNASFGEVSKIVASMWDGLDSDHKSVYKQKTEVAKKEYLKALAAYRASLVSKGGEQENPAAMYNHTNNAPNPAAYGAYYQQGQNFGNGHSPQNYVPTTVPQGYSPQNYPQGQPAASYVPGQPGYQPNSAQQHQSYSQGPAHSPQSYQAIPNQSPQTYSENNSTSPQYQGNMTQSPRGYPNTQSPQTYSATNVSPQAYRTTQSPPSNLPSAHTMQYHHHPQQQMQQVQQVHSYQPQPTPQQQQQQQQTQLPPMEQHSPTANNNNTNTTVTAQTNENESRPSSCIRQGCTNPAIANSEWEDEYCSNECVVSHCRDVFTSWVASSNNSMQNFSAVK